MPTLRLVTLNIAHGRGLSFYQKFSPPWKIRGNLRRIGRYLRDCGADVVALQEIDAASHWNWQVNLLDVLQQSCGLAHAEYGINTRREGSKPLAYGNALLSRWPLLHLENRAFGSATLGEKGFLTAEIAFAGHVLPLVNLHLDFRSRQRRIEQIERILDYLIDRKAANDERWLPPIICGDFNSKRTREADAVSHLMKHIQEYGEYRLLPVDQKTFPAHWPAWTLDFVYIPSILSVRRYQVPRRYFSDHRPVEVVVEL